jgi:vanillate O-demethylase monooxygenase subunit
MPNDHASRVALKAPIATADGGPVNYPQNHWWVAALAEEVQPGKLLPRMFLGKSVVLYRTQDGTVAALQNRCIHRAAPLSIGTLEGDNIGCRYHGLQFAPDGKCVHIPTQSNIPRNAAVRAYPVREIGPLIWIWTGDPALAEESSPSDLPWLLDGTWFRISGYMPLKANYMSLKENVLDLTHFGFVHPTTFQIKGWIQPPKVTTSNGVVRYESNFERVPLPHLDAKMTGLTDRLCDVDSWGHSLSPAMHEAGMDARLCDAADGERVNYTWRILHITTPESPRHTHYWWLMGSDYGHEVENIRQWLPQAITEAFLEDKDVLEAIQAAADADPDYAHAGEISVLADQSGLQTRRILAKILDEDQAHCAQSCLRQA